MTTLMSLPRTLLYQAAILVSAGSVLLLLQGCSLAPAIQNNSLDYNTVIEEVSNQSLVTNILRARDNAPLYFPDLSQVRGSVSASASAQASIPYGPTFGAVQTGPFAASSNPTFDIAPSNTKKFYEGILNPISKNYFAHYIETSRVSSSPVPAFLLLVDGIDKLDAQGRITDTIEAGSPPYFDFLDQWSDARIVKAGASAHDLLGPEVKADAKSIIDANNAGLEIKVTPDGMMRLAKKPASTALCFKLNGRYTEVTVDENSIVKPYAGDTIKTSGVLEPSACSTLPSSSKHDFVHYRLHMRSVEGAFYFLGRLQQPGGDRRWLLEDGCSRLPFYIYDHPVPNARFAVKYREGTYYVANQGLVPCVGNPQKMQTDLTTVFLAILNNLLNLNRDADELPTTKAVQTVGSPT